MTWVSQVTGPSSSCVPWSNTPLDTIHPRPCFGWTIAAFEPKEVLGVQDYLISRPPSHGPHARVTTLRRPRCRDRRKPRYRPGGLTSNRAGFAPAGRHTKFQKVIADLLPSDQHCLVAPMVEALWHQLRNRWVYLHTIDTFSTLERLITKYFCDHNTLIPRAELGGRTPDEAFLGRETDLSVQLREQHRAARVMRIAKNRQRRCGACLGSEPGGVA